MIWTYLKYLSDMNGTSKTITLTSKWARGRLKSPASPLFTQSFIQTQIRENIKLRLTGLCAGNSPMTDVPYNKHTVCYAQIFLGYSWDPFY